MKIRNMILIIASMLAVPVMAQTSVTNYATSVTTTTLNGVITSATNQIAVSVTVPVAGIVMTNQLLSSLGFSPGAGNAVSALESIFKDAGPYITNDMGDLHLGGLYNKSDRHGQGGAFAAVTLPLAQQASIGFGGAYIDNQLFDATVNIQLGTTFNYPLIGKVYNSVSSGPDWAFKSKYGLQSGIGAYNFAGATKTWDLGKNWNFSLEGGIGSISQLPGVTWAFGMALSGKF